MQNHAITYWQPLAIEENTNAFGGPSYIIGPSSHQSHRVFIQDAHFKLGQIWSEGDASVFLSIKRPDASIPCSSHIVIPGL